MIDNLKQVWTIIKYKIQWIVWIFHFWLSLRCSLTFIMQIILEVHQPHTIHCILYLIIVQTCFRLSIILSLTLSLFTIYKDEFVFMVFNATFNNFSIISWRQILLVEETEYREKPTDLSQATDKLYHIRLHEETVVVVIIW
jgi:hypothetical protein